MTRKGITRPYDTRGMHVAIVCNIVVINHSHFTENAHLTCGPGPGHYRRVCGNTGSATKRSMSARHREGVHVGYPNSLVQPVDTLGFATPGPTLWRESERGTERIFGLALKRSVKESALGGPGIPILSARRISTLLQLYI